MKVGVLGVTVVEGPDGPAADLPRKQRAVLAALALTPGRDVPTERIVDLVWGEAPPSSAYGTLQAYVSGLRRVLEPDLAARARPSVLVTGGSGYRLVVAPGQVDAVRFDTTARERRAALAPLWSQLSTGPDGSWPDADTVAAHVEALEEALRLWRGDAFADLGDHLDVAAERARLDEQRSSAEEEVTLGLLALGEHGAVITACEAMAVRRPLRDRVRCLHAVALARTGRQADALAVLRDHRRRLDEDLGLRPGAEVRHLEQAILRQDPRLAAHLRRAVTLGAAAPAPPPRPRAASWPTVGRARETAELHRLLDQVVAGEPRSVLVVGDPGIGKSRLVADAEHRARELGMAAVVARCSADDGAPPLWPWYAVLDGLDLEPPADLGALTDSDAMRAFAVQDALARAVRRLARRRAVLLVLEDLHWADTLTLRALAHLVSTLAPGERLALVLTRRRYPEPTGALLDLGARLARHDVPTIELAGLRADDARELLDALTSDDAGDEPAEVPVAAWCERTGGNPFFLIELARASAAGAARSGEVPASVRTVVAERLAGLPDATRETLLLAAALGREHSPLLLARVGGWSADEVLERLQPAQQLGLLRDGDNGRLAFEHALTRDAVLAGAGAGRTARAHARIAATLEAAAPPDVTVAERTFDLARHWLAAGPVHAARAWRAAVAAAREARREAANAEAAALYRSALAAHGLDPAATRDERYDLLIAYADVAARAARWSDVVEAVTDAVRLARDLGDPGRVASASSALTRYNMWLPMPYARVFEDLVDDLRAALGTAGPQGTATRCQLMLSLAVQLYYAPGAEPEIEALVDEGLAIAQRLGDPELRGWAARSAWLALWRARHLGRRWELAREEVDAALESGDDAAEAVARAALAGVAVEAGDLDTWRAESAAAEAVARRRRIPYVVFALGLVRLSLDVLGDGTRREASTAALRALLTEVTTPADESMDFTLAWVDSVWHPERAAGLVDALTAMLEGDPEEFVRPGAIFLMTRGGRLDDVRALLDREALPPVPDVWHMTLEAAQRAEIGARLGDRGLAREAERWLRTASGRLVVAGISVGLGPVDGYLALALATLDRRAEAARAADRAVELATRWGMRTYLAWLADRRADLRF